MTEWLLALVPQYGIWLLALATFASCLALPIPASLLMLAGGGFASAGDLSLAGTLAASLAGAIAGDQAGYAAGRWGGTAIAHAMSAPGGGFAKAGAILAKDGAAAVFLTRWLISALGPYVNLAAGAAGQPWSVFTLSAVLGECVWVTLYVGLGWMFTGNLETASAMAVDILGLLAAGAIALALGWWLFRRPSATSVEHQT
ncbi:MAG: VTT domain-containing protein [Rhizobiaceae bacterium]|nr:VTT domain-containing protein [Rhizobiaceae bacterium]